MLKEVAEMVYAYYIVEEIRFITSKNEFTTYGISVSSEGLVLNTISDISTDYAFVKSLADLCNRLQLHPMQLKEVVEDFLNTYKP